MSVIVNNSSSSSSGLSSSSSILYSQLKCSVSPWRKEKLQILLVAYAGCGNSILYTSSKVCYFFVLNQVPHRYADHMTSKLSQVFKTYKLKVYLKIKYTKESSVGMELTRQNCCRLHIMSVKFHLKQPFRLLSRRYSFNDLKLIQLKHERLYNCMYKQYNIVSNL